MLRSEAAVGGAIRLSTVTGHGPTSPARATRQPGLLAGQRQIGFDLDHVGQLKDQQLRDLHAMVGERGRELRPDPEVIGGEAKTLLCFEFLRCVVSANLLYGFGRFNLRMCESEASRLV
jgi:hypothetical protein